MRRRPRSRRLAARSDRCVFSLKRSGAEWAPFLDGERAGGTADDNGEALFSELWPKRRVQRRRTIHDPAARRQGAVCKPPVIPINLLLTITAQHCLITESRHGPRSEGAIDRSSWGRAEARGAPRSNVMSSPGIRQHTSLLSEFVPAIFGALGLGVPIAVAIIWICS
jgi:hypothetical protein